MTHAAADRTRRALLAFALAGLSACASVDAQARRAMRVPFAELGQRPDALKRFPEQPLMLIFEPGEHVPARFDLNSTLIATSQSPLPFELIVAQRFYLLLLPKGAPRLSRDGVHFGGRHKHGFRFGFRIDKQAAQLDLGLAIWPHAPAPH